MVGLLEGVVDHAHDRFFERKAVGRENVGLVEPFRTGHLAGVERQAGHTAAAQGLKIHSVRVVENDGAFQFMGEFTDIARPGIAHERFTAGRAERFFRDAMAFGERFQKHLCESEDVVAPVAERRNINAEQIEAMIEIFAELPFGN